MTAAAARARRQLRRAAGARRTGRCCARSRAGTNPGFTASDANGETWFLQFDAPAFPKASSAAVEIATKLFWALGYNQVETFITTFDPAHVEIDPKATIKRPDRRAERRSRRTTSTRVLERAARNADGTYRASAGRLLPGKVLGAFRYEGTRSDDPERPRAARAPARAARAARLRRVDEPGRLEGRQHARHARRGERPTRSSSTTCRTSARRSAWRTTRTNGTWAGSTSTTGRDDRRRLLTFGFALSPWQTVPYTEYPSVGLFEGDRFDPTTWKPQTPIARLHGAARRRCVLGGAAGDGVHRRSDSRGGAHRPVQRPGSRTLISPTCSSSAATRSGAPICRRSTRSSIRVSMRRAADLRERGGGRADSPRRRPATAPRGRGSTTRPATTRPIGETRSATTSMTAPAGLPASARQLRRDRHHRRQRGPPVVAAAGAHILPPHERRLDTRRPRAPARTSGRRAVAAAATKDRR